MFFGCEADRQRAPRTAITALYSCAGALEGDAAAAALSVLPLPLANRSARAASRSKFAMTAAFACSFIASATMRSLYASAWSRLTKSRPHTLKTRSPPALGGECETMWGSSSPTAAAATPNEDGRGAEAPILDASVDESSPPAVMTVTAVALRKGVVVPR